MGKQQGKRRRKKYQAASAYAGDVKPTGFLGFLSGGGMIKFIFIGMALALAIGGGAAVFSGDVFRSSPTADTFVEPDDNDDAEPGETPSAFEPKRYAAAPDLTIDPDAEYTATIRTAAGDIEVELLADEAPDVVNNFVFLARDGFYNGLRFHYILEGFSAQAGDPQCSVDAPANLCRGDGGPGYELGLDGSGDFTAGTLGMANASQFFIAMGASSEFAEFPAFGRIVSGMDIVEQLTVDTPIESIDVTGP